MIGLPPFPSYPEVSAIADWVELTALAAGKALSRGKLQNTLARESSPVTLAEDAWSELKRRGDLFGATWPFEFDDAVLDVRKSGPSSTLYIFLTALSLRENVDAVGRELFEHCVADLVLALTGTPGLRLGHPRRAPVPKSLAKAVGLYCEKSHEQRGPLSPLASDRDLGLDVTTWMSFADGRGCYVHFMGQCATGADWREKLTELNPLKWKDHINWAVPPVRFFATPFVLLHEEFRRRSLDGGLILDRPRLMMLKEKIKLGRGLNGRLQRYCAQLY